MSDAAFTLSTAPIWSTRNAVCCRKGRNIRAIVRLTTLNDVRALLGQLDIHHVPETFLGVVRDRDGPNLGLVIVNDRLVVLGVPLRCRHVRVFVFLRGWNGLNSLIRVRTNAVGRTTRAAEGLVRAARRAYELEREAWRIAENILTLVVGCEQAAPVRQRGHGEKKGEVRRNEGVEAARRDSVRQVSNHGYGASLLWLGRYVKFVRGDKHRTHTFT